ncbi:hypothetical protein HMSSN036_27410 [Paenibacillus macerans]|nr:hypothetical protein HMSSN036_27410 [Paenibacillus macerans]
MRNNRIKVGNTQAHWNQAGTRILKYSVEMYDSGLNEHKVISAPGMDILRNKIDIQILKWEEKWSKLETRRMMVAEQEASIEEAARMTLEAQEAISIIDNLLTHTLSIDDTVNWDVLKKNEEFPEKIPPKPNPKAKREYPDQPRKEEPVFTFIEKNIQGEKRTKN